MSNLVERYVHEVGRNLPKKDRTDIGAELRSLILDRLEDRYGAAPTEHEVAAVLKEMGHPRTIAVKYRREQYLVGPDLYPYMVAALRYVWVTLPLIVGFLHIFDALSSPAPRHMPTAVLGAVGSAVYTTFIVSAVVVLLFAISEQLIDKTADKGESFDPTALPWVGDPRAVERFDAIFGVVFGAIAVAAFLYFLRVGGLTLRFDLSNPGDVIPVPAGWLIALIVVVVAMIGVHIYVLRTNQWTAALWLAETLLELFGMVCLYFVLYEPVLQRLVATVPPVAEARLDDIPELIVVLSALGTAVGRGGKLLRLWNDRDGAALPTTASIEI